MGSWDGNEITRPHGCFGVGYHRPGRESQRCGDSVGLRISAADLAVLSTPWSIDSSVYTAVEYVPVSSKPKSYTLNRRLKPIIVVIDRPLLKRIDKASEKLGVNRSVFIRQAAEEKLANA